MGRPPRIIFPGLIYHVLNRGNNKQIVFKDKDDYLTYLSIVRRYKSKFNFKVLAYCPMPNHIHLILRTSAEGTISEIMQAVTLSHTRHYHNKFNSCGHVWQGRFKSPMVSDDAYLLTLMCYVEQNPVRAGIVNHPSEYSFTSYHAHAEDRVDDLVDKEDNPVYMALAKTMPERAVRYQRIVSTLLNEDKLRAIRGSLSGHSHFCSGEFITKVGENILMNRKRRRGRPLKRA